MLLKEIVFKKEKCMKIVVIILCAFLLKVEVQAQTWWNISPKNMDIIKKMQMIQATDGRMHLLVNSDTTVYSLVDGKRWNSAVSFIEDCMVHHVPYYLEIRFQISSIIQTENDSLLIIYDGFSCGSIDASKTFFVKTTIENLFDYKLDTLFKAGGYAGSKNLALYDSVNKKYYLTLADWGRVYFTEFKESGYERFKMQELPIEYPLSLSWAIGDLFVLDSRNTEIYITVFTDSVSLYKRSLQDTVWRTVAILPRVETSTYKPKPGFSNLSFHSLDTNISFIATDDGLWRYNDSQTK
jgi:hypothetical protein